MGILTNFGSKLSLCDHDALFCTYFEPHNIPSPTCHLRNRKTMMQIQQGFGKQGTRPTTNCVAHVNTHNSLQASGSASERIDTNIKCASCETNGCHDCINFSTSVEARRSNCGCSQERERESPLHPALLGFLLEEDLSTTTLSSDPKRLHLECPPTANPSQLLTIL